jgi:hypothetical protein
MSTRDAITDEVREEAVLMLACAVDLLHCGYHFVRLDASRYLDTSDDAMTLAYAACEEIGGDRDDVQLLSAAAALEDGWTP